jgi:hypothetical protein
LNMGYNWKKLYCFSKRYELMNVGYLLILFIVKIIFFFYPQHALSDHALIAKCKFKLEEQKTDLANLVRNKLIFRFAIFNYF